MSRRMLRSVFGALILAGGLALAPPHAEAAGKAAQEPGVWSLALQWATELWEAKVARLWETEGWLLDPSGSEPPALPEGQAGDEGWMVDPNG